MKRIVWKLSIFLAFFALSIFPMKAFAEKPRPIILGFGGDPLMSMFQLTFPTSGRIKLVQEIISGHAVKNKPSYRSNKMDWQIYESRHFKLYSYEDSKGSMINWYLSILEEAYENNSKRFGINTFEEKIPVIIYSSRKDFEETNVTPAFIPRTLGGFTETQARKRVVMPFSGSKEKMRHVLEHELTHSFQVEALKKQVYGVPLWFIEGMAEHNSKSWDAEADLILRDAYLNGFLPSLEQNSFAYGFLLYKYGEFTLNYLNDNCKSEETKDPVIEILSKTRNSSFTEALKNTCKKMTLGKLDQALRVELGKRYGDLKSKEVVYFKSQLLAKNSMLLDASNYFFLTQGDHFGREAIYLNYRKDDGVEIVSEKITESGRYETEELPAYGKISGNKIAYVIKKGNNDAVVIQEFQLDKEQKIKLGQKKEYLWKEIRDISNLVFTSASSLALIGNGNEFEQIYLFNLDSNELRILAPGNNDFKGLAYSDPLKILVTSIDNATDGKKTNFDLISIDPVNGKIQRLMQTPENETTADFSPNGKSLLFVSDKGSGYNLYSYNFENGIISKLTDARIGAFNPRWLSENAIAFNSFNMGGMEIYAMPLPKGAVPKKEKAKPTEDAEAKSRLKKLLKEKIANWEDYEVIQEVFSGDKKTAVAVVNLSLSFEGRVKKQSPIGFFVADLEKQNVQQFSIAKLKKIENLSEIELLQGSNALIGYRIGNDYEKDHYTTWYLYNWRNQKLEVVERPVKQVKNNGLLGKGIDISKDGRYIVIKKSGKISLIDALENKVIWNHKKAGLVGINLSSGNVLTILREINKPIKAVEFLALSIPSFSTITTYGIPITSLGDKNSKIENWAVSQDNQQLIIDVKHENKRLFKRNIESHELRLINIPQNKTEIIASKLVLISEMSFNNKGLTAKGINSFGNICDYSVYDSSKTATIIDEPVLISTETAKLPVSKIIIPSFQLEKIVKRKGARPPSRFPNSITGSVMGGMVLNTSSGKPFYSLALSVYGSDDLGNKAYGANAMLLNESGLGTLVYQDLLSGQTFALQYWNMGEKGKSVTLSYAKNIFINKYLNWDITASEERVEFKNKFPYKWLSERSLKTRVGTTFSLDTTVWNNHGPHSGNVFFTGTEMAVDSRGKFSSLDMTLEGRNYLPITKRSGFAFRLASGKSVGPDPTIFVMGGNKAFRGMPFLKVYGNNYILGSADLRVPLLDFIGAQVSGPAKYGLWPFMVFIDVQSGVYIDGGNAWYNKDQKPYGGSDAFIPDYSAGYFINVPTAFGLTLRFSRGVYGQKGSTFWIGYNW